MIGFFYLQGVAVLLEDLWKRFTGRRVDGLVGRLWTWSWLTVTAHLLVEAWYVAAVKGEVLSGD